MKLGVITSLWAYAEGLSVVDTLQRIASLGLHHVDMLGILHGHPYELEEKERKAIKNQLQALGLNLGSVVLLPPGNIASGNQEEVDECMAYVRAGIELSAQLGGKQVLFNGGKRAFDLPHNQSWDNAVAFLSKAADYAQDAGIDITVEAEPYVYYLVKDFDTTLAMVKQVDHPNLLAVLDVGHMNLSRDSAGRLFDVDNWLGRVHFSENDGLLHANDILGTGTVPYEHFLPILLNRKFCQTAEARGYEFCGMMELGVLSDSIPNPDQWAERSIDFISKLAPEMEM